jgi:predicted nucleotidyltransferase
LRVPSEKRPAVVALPFLDIQPDLTLALRIVEDQDRAMTAVRFATPARPMTVVSSPRVARLTQFGHYPSHFGHIVDMTRPRTTPRRHRGKPALRRGGNLSDALFGATQQRVLALLFGHPDRSYFASEIIARTASGSGAVQRELARLLASGLVTMEVSGRQKHYRADPASPIFAELRSIVRKTFGVAEPLRAALTPLADQISAAFVYGSVAAQQDTAQSDIDLFVVSDGLTYGEVFAALEATRIELGRPINATVYTRAEFARKPTDRGGFLQRVLAQPKIWLIGDDRALRL